MCLPYTLSNNRLCITLERCGTGSASDIRPLVGTCTLRLSEAENWGMQWVDIKARDAPVCRLLVGCFPTVPTNPNRLLSISSGEDGSSNAKFWEFKKKKELKSKQDTASFIERFVREHVVSGRSYDPVDLMQLLDLVKEDRGRSLGEALARAAAASELGQALLPHTSYLTLIDVLQAALRESNNKGDFMAAKTFFDCSFMFAWHTAEEAKEDPHHMFVYSAIKAHEVFRNIGFWEAIFVDVYSSERQIILRNMQPAADEGDENASFESQPDSVAQGALIWGSMSEQEQTRARAFESNMVRNLLGVFAMQMLNSTISLDVVLSFVDKYTKLYAVPSVNTLALVALIEDASALMLDPLKTQTATDDTVTTNPRRSTLIEPPTRAAATGTDVLTPTAAAEAATANVTVGGVNLNVVQLKRSICDEIKTGDLDVPHMPRVRRANSSAQRTSMGKGSQMGDWIKYQTGRSVLYYHNVITNEIAHRPPNEFANDKSTATPGSGGSKDSAAVGVDHKAAVVRVQGVLETILGEIELKCLKGIEYITPSGDVTLVRGDLYLTNYRLCFLGPAPLKLSAPIHSLNRIEDRDNIMHIWMKDLSFLRFRITADSKAALFRQEVEKHAFPSSQLDCFAFSFRDPFSATVDGWSLFNLQREFERQGVWQLNYWRISDVNRRFEYASTYTPHIVVPCDITDEDLLVLKKFRSKARVPSLCFRYAATGAVMLRSSQPMVGFTGKRSAEDEKLLDLARVRTILDSRPKANAVANQAKGGGFESVSAYNRTEIEFCGIQNIHAMRESLQKVQAICMEATFRGAAMDDFATQIDNTTWLRHVSICLAASIRTAALMRDFTSVLVHCSDGWDRTAQMCSLAQLLLDPYYRTTTGFAVLVEKEWCMFGHKFADRHGHMSSDANNHERSPIFLQFLDCCWQIYQQFPGAFEFNESLFDFLANHVTSCQFGTFLFNNAAQREQAQVRSRTVSIWTAVFRRFTAEFNNPFYRPVNGPLEASSDARLIKLWPYYYRWDEKVLPQRPSVQGPAKELLMLEKDSNHVKTKWFGSRMDEWRTYCGVLVQQLMDAGVDPEDIPAPPSVSQLLADGILET